MGVLDETLKQRPRVIVGVGKIKIPHGYNPERHARDRLCMWKIREWDVKQQTFQKVLLI